MSAALISLLALSMQTASIEQDCPSYLVHVDRRMTRTETRIVQRYADCIERPSLPVSAQLSGRMQSCAAYRPPKLRKPAKWALTWVDRMAAQLPACETRLTIKTR